MSAIFRTGLALSLLSLAGLMPYTGCVYAQGSQNAWDTLPARQWNLAGNVNASQRLAKHPEGFSEEGTALRSGISQRVSPVFLESVPIPEAAGTAGAVPFAARSVVWSASAVPISPQMTRMNESKSWWSGHPILTGTLIGALTGIGIGIYYYSTDDYCRDPDMFSCEPTVVIAGVGGAALGATIGWLIGRH